MPEDANFRVYEQQVRLLYSLQPVGLIATAVNAAIVAALHLRLAPPVVLATWLAALGLLVLIRAALLVPARRSLSRGDRITFWANVFVAGMMASGIVWGCSAFFVSFHDSRPHHMLVAYVLGGMAAGAAGTFSALRSAYLAFTIPALLPQIVVFFVLNEMVYTSMGGMLIFFWVLLTKSALTNRETAITSFRLRFEREDLVASLTAAHATLHRTNDELIQEIARRRGVEIRLREAQALLEEKVAARTAELQTANRRLADLNQELSEFARSVSHDLRSPLHIVSNFCTMLEAPDAGLDDEQRRYASFIHQAATRMHELIEDLLRLSQAGQRELHRTQVDLSAMARDIIEKLQSANPRHAPTLIVSKGLSAFCDERLIRIALENLLDNAWKYTAKTDNPRIEFVGQTAERQTVYCVRDNGAGFDMTAAHKLFSPFQRLHSDAAFPGTGLGLTTVKRVITRHGGRLWYESRPGGGASFYFTIHEPPQENR